MMLLMPVSALAEDSKFEVRCKTTMVCDGFGTCSGAAHAITFKISEVEDNGEGVGDYQIGYDDVTATAHVGSSFAPLVWSDGDGNIQSLLNFDRQRLITNMLWHTLYVSENAGRTEIRFLTCDAQTGSLY